MYAALLMFCVYILGCYVIGYRFPFDKFELYAGIANRDQAAVPLFLVDDQEGSGTNPNRRLVTKGHTTSNGGSACCASTTRVRFSKTS